METAKFIFWIITGATSLSFVIAFFFVKQWVTGINEKFTKLFERIDEFLIKMNKLVDEDEFKDLEKRVREIENSMNQCDNCKFNK